MTLEELIFERCKQEVASIGRESDKKLCLPKEEYYQRMESQYNVCKSTILADIQDRLV